MSTTPSGFEDWIGRTRESQDIVTERLVASFRAIFDPYLAPQRGDAVPLGLHWCLMPEIAATDELGQDGHPAKNRYLPPVPLPRRMWAGGSVETGSQLCIGDHVRRISTISEIVRKDGRSGQLWFVTIYHDYLTARGLAIRERQDLVYREAASSKAVAAANALSPELASALQGHALSECGEVWTLTPAPPLLFRYSAITFNGHRIHYDLPYARDIEGYAGLVVHGPLQATLLLNLAAKVAGTERLRMAYRGLAPAICGSALRVCAGTGSRLGQLWTEGLAGQTHMSATVTVAN